GRWLKQPGDHIEKGDIIAEIETDKATMELEAFESGTLQQILVPEGQTVPIGQTIGIIGDGQAAPAQAAPPQPPAQQAAAPAPSSATPPSEGGGQATSQQTQRPAPAPGPQVATAPAPASVDRGNGHEAASRVKASPLARRLAEEYGIDLRQ